jgi:hypothetical protein
VEAALAAARRAAEWGGAMGAVEGG